MYLRFDNSEYYIFYYAYSRFFGISITDIEFVGRISTGPCSDFLSGVFYLIVVLLRSVAMGSMLITAYHLFCIFFSGHGDLRQFCLIRPNINAEKDTLPYLGIIVVAVTTYITSAVIEHTFYKKRI